MKKEHICVQTGSPCGFPCNHECPVYKDKTITRFLVVWEEKSQRYLHMETVWTDDEIENVGRWRVVSDHKTKDDARIECDRLNGVSNLPQADVMFPTNEEIEAAAMQNAKDYWGHGDEGMERGFEHGVEWLTKKLNVKQQANLSGMIPFTVVEDFIWESGEDYHLWDEETQGQYPVKRMIVAMSKWWTDINKKYKNHGM